MITETAFFPLFHSINTQFSNFSLSSQMICTQVKLPLQCCSCCLCCSDNIICVCHGIKFNHPTNTNLLNCFRIQWYTARLLLQLIVLLLRVFFVLISFCVGIFFCALLFSLWRKVVAQFDRCSSSSANSFCIWAVYRIWVTMELGNSINNLYKHGRECVRGRKSEKWSHCTHTLAFASYTEHWTRHTLTCRQKLSLFFI